jgi:hypothetical protein
MVGPEGLLRVSGECQQQEDGQGEVDGCLYFEEICRQADQDEPAAPSDIPIWSMECASQFRHVSGIDEDVLQAVDSTEDVLL